MAARKSAPAPTTDAVTTEDVLRSIFETTTDGQSSMFAVAEELNIDGSEVLDLLENVSDDFLGSDAKGNLWLTGDYFDAADMLSNYRATHAPEGVTVLGTDDMSVLIESVKSVDTTPAVPVESSQTDDNTEDGDMDDTKALAEELANGTNDKSKGWTNDGGPTHYVDYDPTNVTGHMILPEVEIMDAPPAGVSPNYWELYKAANTAPARLFWAKKVAAQIKAHADAVAAAETAPEVAPMVLPVDPVTGQPLAV